jgi:hypothetical protein
MLQYDAPQANLGGTRVAVVIPSKAAGKPEHVLRPLTTCRG